MFKEGSLCQNIVEHLVARKSAVDAKAQPKTSAPDKSAKKNVKQSKPAKKEK